MHLTSRVAISAKLLRQERITAIESDDLKFKWRLARSWASSNTISYFRAFSEFLLIERIGVAIYNPYSVARVELRA